MRTRRSRNALVCAIVTLAGLVALANRAAAADEPLPAFVQALIAKLEAAPVQNPPASIWRYDFRGGQVYYLPPRCCDVPSILYDHEGTYLCSPDGGISGQGDGRCRDFYAQRSNGVEVWHDPRRRR